MHRLLGPALAVAAALGIGMLVLQRYVAETRGAAIALVAAWAVIVGVAILIVTGRRPDLRRPLAATWLAVVIGTVAIGYWTGFRDIEVMEEVAIASARASGDERDRALGGNPSTGQSESGEASSPIELAGGSFAGADGHAGAGKATVVEQPDGDRVLTFTEFDVDPGVAVEVYLSPSPDDVSDRVELGGLKGNIGDQQYEVPSATDLREYSNVVLWCTPFTVRIAVAELDA